MPTLARKINKKKRDQDDDAIEGSENLESALKKKSTHNKSTDRDGISQGNIIGLKRQAKKAHDSKLSIYTSNTPSLNNKDNEKLKQKLAEAQKWLAAIQALLQAKLASANTTTNNMADINNIAVEGDDEIESENEDNNAQLTLACFLWHFRILGEVPTRQDAVNKPKRRLYREGNASKLLSSHETTPDNHDGTSNSTSESESLRRSPDANTALSVASHLQESSCSIQEHVPFPLIDLAIVQGLNAHHFMAMIGAKWYPCLVIDSSFLEIVTMEFVVLGHHHQLAVDHRVAMQPLQIDPASAADAYKMKLLTINAFPSAEVATQFAGEAWDVVCQANNKNFTPEDLAQVLALIVQQGPAFCGHIHDHVCESSVSAFGLADLTNVAAQAANVKSCEFLRSSSVRAHHPGIAIRIQKQKLATLLSVWSSSKLRSTWVHSIKTT
ncbi:uncharacterized protein PHACADRAFT_33179 [Phanerochaete carnosa HHB-10118-sp]|uniref:DUF6532 domain-containing protein n=1 Tax=Phanerochaete carnosa (strain HHB-10118-sp) TaxID=650164 RepID=K5VEJ9_PHACS|nr:uncharacterized protein PHACADRAFT_33179 [Phanerochaete carnosa HHB-10118-sp]EKM49588.1 hypothetical protein PHACADRAFT_33179 [Phanerochaete carnosa HHB-10118-sp]